MNFLQPDYLENDFYITSFKITISKPGVVVQTGHPSTGEAGTGDACKIKAILVYLGSEFQSSYNYIIGLCFQTTIK